MRKTALVCGAGGFIGGHLVRSLMMADFDVRAVDIKPRAEWYQIFAQNDNRVMDLQEDDNCFMAVDGCDLVYNLAADMGGMGFIENNKAQCMLSVLINTNLLRAALAFNIERYFYASSACVYAADKQTDSHVTALKEADAYPAMPEDGYGWEKLFSERMCRHFTEDFGLVTRVARFHNVYGPYGTWYGGREKAPAAICRKVLESVASDDYNIDIWGDGEQTRSFMYISDCVEGIHRIMTSDTIDFPVNLGSTELVSINELVDMVAAIEDVELERHYDLSAPQGVRGRNSDNTLLLEHTGWEPSVSLADGLAETYEWIQSEMIGLHS